MWSIMSSMKLRRKTSKRGEGDINVNTGDQQSPPSSAFSTAAVSAKDRSPNTDCREPTKLSPSANSSTSTKIERKESTRLASSATKFLRSLRTGHLGSSSKESHVEPSTNIALVELKPNPESQAVALLTDRGFHPPERSQSFQEKRLGVSLLSSTSAKLKALGQSSSPGSKNNNGIYSAINPNPVKVKHSRTQSFICTGSQQNPGTPVNAVFKRETSNYSLNHTNIIALSSNPNGISFCPDPQQQQLHNRIASESHYSTVASINAGRKNPYETIYENLEIIRQQHAKHHRSKVKSSSSSSLKAVDITVVDASIKTSSTFSSTGNIMTIFEKEKERRLPATRKMSKDTCYYEINYSDYMNIDSANKSTDLSVNNPENVGLQLQHREAIMANGVYHARNASTPCLSSAFSVASDGTYGSQSNMAMMENQRLYSTPIPSCSTSTATLPSASGTSMTKTSSLKPNAFSSTAVSENGIITARKLRRSISEAKPGSTAESISLAKFQTKVVNSSKTIYSSVSNGLSVWSSQKSGNYISKNNSGSGKDSPYPIYSSALSPVSPAPPAYGKNGTEDGVRHEQQQQIFSSTLPRPSQYQTSVKLSPSLRQEAEQRPRALNNLSRTSSSITLSKSSNLINHNRGCGSSASFSVTASRSTPNLKEELKVYQPLTPNSLNSASQSQLVSQQQHARSNSVYQPVPSAAAPNRSASVKLYNNNANQYYHLPRTRSRIVSTPPCDSHKRLVQFPNSVPSGPPYAEISNEHVYENSSCSSNTSTRKNSSDSSSSKEEFPNSTPTMSNDSSPKSTTGPPVRDSASIKHVKYGPGHEKYPSWPVSAASAGEIDPAGELSSKMLPNGGSSRSKSWTEQTDYPKEKVQSYARPYMKRASNHGSYTQQLKTVMESERPQPADAPSPASNGGGTIGLPAVPPPMGYRDPYKVNGIAKSPNKKALYMPKGGDEKEYNIPSPPERDSVGKALTEEDLEIYAKKYEERMSQYAQSEGYHSYISSECSSYISSGTPFLDQLRRESESNEEFWCGDSCDPNDPLFSMSHLATSGRESVTTVVTNSSGSSGTETLKWQGSNGDLTGNSINNNSSSSNSSSAGSVSAGSRGWERNIVRSAKVPSPRKIHPDAVLVHNGVRHIKSKLEAGSSAKKQEHNLKKFPLSTYTRPSALTLSSEKKQQASVATAANSAVPEMKKCNKVISPVTPSHTETKQGSPIIDTSKPPSVAERILELEQQQSQQSSISLKSNPLHHHQASASNLTTSSPGTQATVKDIPSAATSNDNISSPQCASNFTDKFVKSSSLANLRETACKAQPQHPASVSHVSVQRENDEIVANSASPSSLGYHNMWSPTSSSESNLLRSDHHHRNNSGSTNNSHASTPVFYTYLDPEKKHKVADLTLKEIQKKALLAYYERHTGKSSTGSPPRPNDEVSLSQSPGACFSPTNESASRSFNGGACTTNEDTDKDLSHSTLRSLSTPRENDGTKSNTSVTEDLSHHSVSAYPSHLNKETRLGDVCNNNHHNNSPSLSSHSASSCTSAEFNTSSTNSTAIHGQSTHDLSSTPKTSSKGDFGRTSMHQQSSSQQVNSLPQKCEDANGESARMAYMSKYLPHLTSRDRDSTNASLQQSTRNSLMAKPSDGGVALSHDAELVPTPPERPPKKPHLRNVSQHGNDGGNESNKPPPPLPRAPIRHPQPHLGNINTNANGAAVLGLPPPLPSKPQPHMSLPQMSLATTKAVTSLTVKRCSTPDLPLPPPPPPISDQEHVVISDDDPLPPPPSPNEVGTIIGPKSRLAASQSSSYLHKDSYLAQRKERSLGYEGRYRRTLSPSGLGTNSGDRSSDSSASSSASSTEKMDSTLSPTAWEKIHNIGAPSTTVVFSSHEISKCSQPVTLMNQASFHRSASGDNLVNNKTGFSQPTMHPATHLPPPIAQVAPLRGLQPRLDAMDSYQYNSSYAAHNGRFNDTMKSYTLNAAPHNPHQGDTNGMSAHRSSSLNQSDHKYNHHRLSRHSTDEPGVRTVNGCKGINGAMQNDSTYKDTAAKKVVAGTMTDAQCQITPNGLGSSPNSTAQMKGEQLQSVTVVVSPLRFESMNGKGNKIGSPVGDNKENSRFVSGNDASSNKSEVSFRVNCTSDAASQTESGNEDDKDEGDSALPTEPNSLSLTLSSKSSSVSSSCNDMTSSAAAKSSNGSIGPSHASNSPSPTMSLASYKGREKSQEELDCEELSRDLAKQLPQGDKLQTLLAPLPQSKTSAHYMEGLFHIETRRPDQAENGRNSASPDCSKSPDTQKAASPNSPQQPTAQSQSGSKAVERCNGGPLPADSPYFTTSECKAKFLTQYVKDMRNESISSRDSQELIKQKEELVSRISRKLEILRIEHSEIREEIQSNDQLGQIVIERVQQTAKRNEFDKFKLHVEEIEEITSLLLGLSGRLARAENALMSQMDNPNPQEKKILESKRDKLQEQLAEAKTLKENIDRRSAQVAGFLQKYLTEEEFADYQHFTKMKAKLIIDAREIDEKIKLGDEQLVALQETLSFTSSSSSSSTSNTN